MAKTEQQTCYYVYMHTKEDSGDIFYIGAGKGGRAFSKQGRNNYWINIVRKHGYDVFIIKGGLSFSDSRKLEVELIKSVRSMGVKLSNLTDGGEGRSGVILSQEVKDKISKSNKGKNKGKKWTEDRRIKAVKSMTGRKLTEETRGKISKAQKGVKKRNPPWNKGLVMSDEQKSKLRSPKSDAHKKALSESAKKRWSDESFRSKIKIDNSGHKNPRAKKDLYTFESANGERYTGTRIDFKNHTGIDPKALFRAKPQLSVKGWRLCS